MRTCLACGAHLAKRSQRVYCSNACQQALRQRRAVEVWLATGVAVAGTHGDHYLRRCLACEQGGRCALCAAEAQWQGLPLAFVLDHIDGDASNNRRDNLRLLCPNCDSQLPTYKSRNRGRGRHARRQRYADGRSY